MQSSKKRRERREEEERTEGRTRQRQEKPTTEIDTGKTNELEISREADPTLVEHRLEIDRESLREEESSEGFEREKTKK